MADKADNTQFESSSHEIEKFQICLLQKCEYKARNEYNPEVIITYDMKRTFFIKDTFAL